MASCHPLALRSVYQSFTGQEGVIENLTLDVAQGRCLSLLGNNGSGKTTVLRLACGLVAPLRGTVRLFGLDPVVAGTARGRVAAVFDGARALHARLSPLESAVYLARLKGCDAGMARRRFAVLAERFQVGRYATVAARKLSRGTQQKFALSAALASGAQLWLLDEPTLALDAAGIVVLRELIRDHAAAGGAVLMATHDTGFAAQVGTAVQLTESAAAAHPATAAMTAP